MTAREMAEWVAYFECCEPMPDATRDAALIRLTIAQVNGAKDVKLDDFMPKPPRVQGRQQTAEQMMAAFGRATE